MFSPFKTGFFDKLAYSKYYYFFKFWNFIKFIFIIPLIVLHLVIYPFIRIKIGYILSRTIGNSVAAFEIFIYENKNKKKEIIFWVSDNLLANSFWMKKIKQQFSFFTPAFLGKAMYDFYSGFKFFQIFIVPTRNWNSSGNLDLIKINNDLSPNADIYRVLKDNEPFIHAHITMSDHNLDVKGGHLFEAKVGAVGEFILRKIETDGKREYDANIGLFCMKFNN